MLMGNTRNLGKPYAVYFAIVRENNLSNWWWSYSQDMVSPIDSYNWGARPLETISYPYLKKADPRDLDWPKDLED